MERRAVRRDRRRGGRRRWIAAGVAVLLAAGSGTPAVTQSGGDAGSPPSEPARAAAPDTVALQSTEEDRDSVAVTVYNQNFGLVRDLRTLELATGMVALEFGDVASTIQTETVHIRPLGGAAAFQVLEQNYRYDLLSPQKLLEKYVGRTVRVYPEGGDPAEAVEAEVLAVNDGVVLRIGDEITFDYAGRFAFPEVPDDLISRPTLVWLLESEVTRHRVEVSYLARQMNWEADYVLLVNDAEDGGDLTGWVTLTNQSGTTFEAARLQLVAGDVRRVSDRPGYRRPEAMELQAARAADQFQEEAFFEYHLYTLQRPTTLRNNEQKQVTLLEADDFGLRKRLVLRGSPYVYRNRLGQRQEDVKVGVFVEFRNTEGNGLGMPLPAGIVRVYKRDAAGSQQFVGEDRIDHTPRGETVLVQTGEAFDVVADRTQTDFTAVASCVSESAWEIELRNHKDEAVQVELVEPVSGDWQVLSASHDHEKLDASTLGFTVDVPARGDATVTYRIRVRWC